MKFEYFVRLDIEDIRMHNYRYYRYYLKLEQNILSAIMYEKIDALACVKLRYHDRIRKSMLFKETLDDEYLGSTKIERRQYTLYFVCRHLENNCDKILISIYESSYMDASRSFNFIVRYDEFHNKIIVGNEQI